MARGKRALQSCYIAFAGFSTKDTTNGTKWIGNLSGHIATGINNSTSHVIVSEKAWKEGHKILDEARRENDKRTKPNEIKFVTYTWAEDCANNRTKKNEGPYLCERVWASKNDSSRKNDGRSGEKDGVGPRTQQGLVKEMLFEQTEKHLDERSRRELEKELKRQRKLEKLDAEAKREEEEEARKNQADIFQRGAKRAKNEIFTDNHHIYMDATGFKYEIPLTKVDPRNNRNERYTITLQLYESNAEPHTYATNSHFAGTTSAPQNNLLSAIGTNFPTAFHSFKLAFKQYTTIKWDDRIAQAIKRAEKARGERTQVPGNVAGGSRVGVPVANDIAAAAKKPTKFADMPFEYYPPRYGPKGNLPQEKLAELAEFGAPKKGVEKETDQPRVGSEISNAWMSGANGVGPLANPEEPDPRSGLKLTANGDFDFATDRGSVAPQQGLEWHEFEGLMESTYPFEEQYAEDFAPEGTADNATVQHQREGNEATATGEDVCGVHQPLDYNNTNDTQPNPPNNGIDAINADTHPPLSTNDPVTEEYKDDGQATFTSLNFDQELEAHLQASAQATQQTSFNLPASTVAETSFQPGTQKISETQQATRVLGEFDELMDDIVQHVSQEPKEEDDKDKINELEAGEQMQLGQGTVVDDEAVQAHEALVAEAPKKQLDFGNSILGRNLNLGNSMLGKRKAEKGEEEVVGGSKRAKSDDRTGKEEWAVT